MTRIRAALVVLVAAMTVAAASTASASTTNPRATRRQHKQRAVCGATPAGTARCDTHVQTMDDGVTPATSTSPAAGSYGPSDLQSAYNLPSTTAGAGMTVAVVDVFDEPNVEADLAAYRSAYGLPPCSSASGCFRKVNQNGAASPLPAADVSWGQEIATDVEMVSATCPNCHIVLVEANNATFGALATAVNTAAGMANAVSNSYGSTEFSSETSYDSAYNHPGVVMTAASGDDGYGVQYPASSSFVTGVGGTSLVRSSTSRGWSETVWSGAGSGCSAYVTKPSWQTDAGCKKRTVTDVSAVADPSTGVAVYDSYGSTVGNWYVFGGTSIATPIIASTFALGGKAGGLSDTSTLYGEADQLFDVTSGSNGTCTPSYLCTGGPGYDGPSGLGAPNGVGAFGGPLTQQTTSTTRPTTTTSTTRPPTTTSTTTPGPRLSVSPTATNPGGSVTATWSGLASPTSSDWIGMYANSSADNSTYLSYVYTTGTASGSVAFPIRSDLTPGTTYELRLFPNNSYTRVATSNPFAVTTSATTTSTSTTTTTRPTTTTSTSTTSTTSTTRPPTTTSSTTSTTSTTRPPTTTSTTTAGPHLSVSPTTTNPGSNVTATWSGIASPTSSDWIGLFANSSAGDTSYLSYQYTTGAASGSLSFPIPSNTTPGNTYELRLFSNNGYTVLAKSAPFTVTTSAIPSTTTTSTSTTTTTRPPTTTSTSTTSTTRPTTTTSSTTSTSTTSTTAAGPHLSVSPTTTNPGSSVTATWSGIANPTSSDWIGLYATSSDGDTGYLSYVYTTGTASGSVAFPIRSNLPPGTTYELRLFSNNGYTVLAVSAPFTIT